MMRPFLLAGVLLLCSWSLALDAIVPEMDGWGAMRGIRVNGQLVAVKTGLVVPAPAWKTNSSWDPWRAKDLSFALKDGVQQFAGRIPFTDTSVDYREEVRSDGNGVTFRIEATPQKQAPAEGIFLFISVPVGDFAGGTVKVLSPKDPTKTSATCPADKPNEPHFLYMEGSGVEFRKGDRTMTFEFDMPRSVTVQDDRAFGTSQYTVLLGLHGGELKSGETSTIQVTVRAKVPLDNSPATISISDQQTSTLDGFGGTFVFSADSPVAKYNLEHLNIGWSRVWLPLHQWEPERNPADPSDVKTLSANDKPGTEIRKAMDVSLELQKRKIPYIASIWPVPQWLLAKPWDKGNPFTNGGQVPRERWNDLAQSIGSYLVYAKQKYGVEPDMFSFNEPDWGVMVKLSPEEHRDMIKLLGKHFESLGLRTRMLAGDVTNPRDTSKYLEPTIADPEALKYVGAVAFHSWGGGSDAQFAAWHDIGQRAGKPLLVTEAGLDGEGWHYAGMLNQYINAHGEAMQYVQILGTARPQAIIFWEYSEDYSILDIDKSTNPWRLTPAKPYYVLKQLSDPMTRGGKLLVATSSNKDIRAAAVRSADGKRLTLLITNNGAQRPLTITGLPDGTVSVKLTDMTHDAAELPDVPVRNGQAQLDMPAWSVLTLAQR